MPTGGESQQGASVVRLLLVEHDLMIGRSLQRGLKQDGHAVDWVRDGQAAPAAIRMSLAQAFGMKQATAALISSMSQRRQLVARDSQHLALLVQRKDARILVPIDLR